MDIDQLFLHEYEELDRRVRAQGVYETLMIASTLRKLLLDARPLAVAANETRRLRLRFVANCQREDPESLNAKLVETSLFMWSRQDGFDPATARQGSSPPSTMTLDELLKCVLLIWRGHEVTVHEVIDYVAHVAGAVHAGKPKTAKLTALHEMAVRVRDGDRSPEVQSLLAVGRVVLRGLAPLRDAVARDLEAQGVRIGLPNRLPRVSARALIDALEGLGFSYKFAKHGAAGAAVLETVEMFRWDTAFLYSVIVARESDHVRLLTTTAHVLPEKVIVPQDANQAAGKQFATIATLPDLSTDSARAETWVRANIAQPGATVIIGATFFEIDAETTVPGSQYRLMIAAVGARAV